VVYAATPRIFVFDDPYITLHSADVLLSGSDAVFGVPALVGVTSPIYLAVLVGLRFVGFSQLEALRCASALGTTLFLVAVWALGTGLTPLRRVTLTIVTLTSGFCWLQLTNGMETGWALALLLWLIVAARTGRVRAAALTAGLLPFLRPDLFPAVALIVVWLCVTRPWRDSATMLLIIAGVSAPWLLWMHHATGSWLPNTIEAKRLFFAEGCLPLSQKLTRVGTGVGLALLLLFPLSAGGIAVAGDAFGALGLLAMGATFAAYVVAFPSAVFHNYFRYVYPIVVPWLAYGAQRILRARSETFAAVAAGVALAFLPFRQVRNDAVAREAVAAAQAVDSLVPSSAVVLVHDAGAVSVFAHRRAVDMVGLKTPSSVMAHKHWTAPSCGAQRTEALMSIINEFHAEYLVTIADWERLFGIAQGLRAEGIALDAIRLPPTRDGYTIWRLKSE